MKRWRRRHLVVTEPALEIRGGMLKQLASILLVSAALALFAALVSSAAHATP